MSQLFAPRRAAEEFDHALAGEAPPELVARYAPLLGAVQRLRTVPEVMPRAEFSADLRARLLAAARTELPSAPLGVRSGQTIGLRTGGPATAPGRRRLAAAISVAALLVGSAAGVAVAAEGALPGDSLYPVKRGLESAVTSAHLSQSGRGDAHLDSAVTRLGEVRQMLLRGRDDQALTAGVSDFQSSADQGADTLFAAYQRTGDGTDVARVHTFATEQMRTLRELAAARPDRSAALTPAADTLVDLDTEARRLCLACTGDAPVALPAALSDGAAAPTMAALVSRPAQTSGQLLHPVALQRLLAQARQVAAQTPAQMPAQTPHAVPAPSSGISPGGQRTRDGQSDDTHHRQAGITGLTSELSSASHQLTQQATPITGTVTTTVVGIGTKAGAAATSTVDGLTGGLLKQSPQQPGQKTLLPLP